MSVFVQENYAGLMSRPGEASGEDGMTDEADGVRQNRGCSDPGGVKLCEGKVMVPHDEPQGAREVMEAGTLQVSRMPRHKP